MSASRRTLFQRTLGLGAFVVASQAVAQTSEAIEASVSYQASAENWDSLSQRKIHEQKSWFGYEFMRLPHIQGMYRWVSSPARSLVRR